MKKIGIMLLIMVILTGCSTRGENDLVIIDGDIAEMNIATYMAKAMIEANTDYSVYIQPSMAYNLAFDQINHGSMDMTLSWDGTLLATFLQTDPSTVPNGVPLYDFTNQKAAQESHVKLLNKLGNQNSYVVAVSGDLAREHNLTTVSDLIPLAPELVFAAEHSFFDEVGSVRFKPLINHYGLNFKSANSIDIGLKYAGLESQNMDVTLITSADGMMNKYDVVMLEDDLHFFPEYYSAFMVNQDIEEKYPGVEAVLNTLSGHLTDEIVRDLTYQVDVEVRDPQTVAESFLRSKGLIE